MQVDNFKFEKQGAYTFLTYSIGEKDLIDNVGIGMITNNKIGGLLPMIYTQMDDNKYFKYNITSKVSLREFFSGVVNKERLVKAFISILTAVSNTEEYMLDQKNLVFDIDYIFVNVSTNEAEMICIPLVSDKKEGTDILSFFKTILFSVRFDQNESNDYIGKIMNYLNSSSELQSQVFINLLKSIENNDVKNSDLNKNGNISNNFNQNVSSMTNKKANLSVGTNGNGKQINRSVNNYNNSKQGNVSKVNVNIPQKNRVNNVSVMNQQNIQRQYNGMNKPQMFNPNNSNKGTTMPKTNNVYNGMAIPGKQNNYTNKTQSTVNVNNTTEKEISWFYLMQHYNKENAALYKEQKARKKAGKNKELTKNSQYQAQQAYLVNRGNNIANVPLQGMNGNGQMRYIPNQNQRIQYNNNMSGNNFNNAQINSSNINLQQRQNDNITFAQKTQDAGVIDLQKNMLNVQENFGDTVLLDESSESGETTLLNSGDNGKEIRPYLLRVKTNEKIYVDKTVFKIGKERKYVDYCIEGNSAVSRSHASIIYKENKYFVVDTNSTNHTYVDGERIDSNTEVKIKHGTKLRFANEEFEFHVF